MIGTKTNLTSKNLFDEPDMITAGLEFQRARPFSLSKGTHCLGSDELVFKKRLKPFVMKCIWLERYFKSRIQ